MMGFFVSLAGGLGFILSAETLILVGNGVGRAGAWFLFFAVAAAGFHLLGAFRVFGPMAGPQSEADLLGRALGQPAALAFPLAGRLSVTIVAATSLLANAGYVFNEVFVYWFPNFLFAFLLLGLILAVGLAGGRIWAGFQIFVVLAAFSGLAVLILAGFGSSPPPEIVTPRPVGTGAWLQASLGAILLPVGYDLALFANAGISPEPRRSPAAAVLLGTLILILWGIISLKWVAPATLAETTIPYTVAARTILGQKGRIIMGIVILAGVCGAVNALYAGVSNMVAGMSASGLLPAVLGTGRLKGRLPVLFLAFATAVMLITGMAGSSHLKAFLRGGVILWLVHYAVLHMAAFMARGPGDSRGAGRAAHLVGGLALGLSALGLLATHEQAAVVAAFMAIVGVAALFLGLLLTGPARKQNAGR